MAVSENTQIFEQETPGEQATKYLLQSARKTRHTAAGKDTAGGAAAEIILVHESSGAQPQQDKMAE
jgi:hypothetical protein